MALGIFDKVAPVDLPHPPISLATFLVVERAVCAGWHLLLTEPRSGFDLNTTTEDQITHELHEAVVNRIFDSGSVAGFNKQVFAPAIREPKIRNYNFSSLDKMPDLFIQFVNRPTGIMTTQYGLFIECKPVDKSHPIPKDYCDRGIIRFIGGDYAWAMTSALMVAYARRDYTILPHLVDALADRTTTIPTLSPPQPCSASLSGPANEVVHISLHNRTFQYLENGKDAGAITIRHLWLSRD